MVSSIYLEKLQGFVGNKWLVFVCAMWDMSFAGTAYMFGSISPVIKSNMGYNQHQVALLSVAKDLGDNVGLIAGKISESSPMWVVILLGVFQNVVGYGLVWLVVSHRLPSLPLWMLCICILVGQNGSTYYNTAAIVSCVRNFPHNRGPVVGILKAFLGLSGAIWTQIAAMISFHNQSFLIFIVAVGPAMVSFATMFIIRPIKDSFKKQSTPSDDNSGFNFVYGVCVLLAAYLMGILLLQNMLDLDHKTITLLGIVMIILMLLPILVPITIVFFLEPKSVDQESQTFLLEESMDVATISIDSSSRNETSATNATHLEDNDDNNVTHDDSNAQSLGEEFSIRGALVNGEFWIMFLSLSMSGGSGLTVINNMGQMCQSLGDNNVNVYVSVVSISSALGRVAGGYFSEVIVRNFGHSRLVALVLIQGMMAMGLSYYAMGLVGQLYIVAITMGFGYGAHWSISIPTASELFGLKNFGTIFNFLAMSCPAGTLILSGFVASTIYDYYAEQQRRIHQCCYGNSLTSSMPCVTRNDEELLVCEGNICFSLTCGILAIVCIVAAALNMILVSRTKMLYVKIYSKNV